jgi:hypothetical protein
MIDGQPVISRCDPLPVLEMAEHLFNDISASVCCAIERIGHGTRGTAPVRARRGEIMKVEDVCEILSIPLLRIILESGEVLRSSNVGAPVALGSPASAPAHAYLDAALRLRGQGTGIVLSSDKPRPFHRLFTRRAA